MADEHREDDEWEGGQLEEAPQDEPAPELPDSEELDAKLAELESEEGFDEPLIDDPGVSPIPQEDGQLDEGLASLEADEPFQHTLEKSASAIEPVSEPDSPDVSDPPDDESLTPPGTLKEFYEAGGTTSGTSGSLPGFPEPSKDGPMDPLKQYLDSGYSMAQLQSDLLIDHSSQLDMLTESLERGRL